MSPDVEVARLAEHEATIARGLETFVEVGEALAAIRDERLYRATHGTFEDYCRERWAMVASRARQLIGAAETVTSVTLAGLPAPTNEAQARELARVPEPKRAEVWRETLDRTGGKPTAAAVREVAEPRPVTEWSDRTAAEVIAETPELQARPGLAAEPEPYVDQVPPAAFVVPVPAPGAPTVEEFLDSSQGLQDARYRQAYVDVLAKMPAVSRFDAERLAPLLTEEHVWLTEELAKSLGSFANTLRQLRTGLRVIHGGDQ